MKLICVGRNYAAHIDELKNAKPNAPILFIKSPNALIAPKDDFRFPTFSQDIRYEVEVLLKISQTAKNISVAEAPYAYHKIGLGIDFTAADVQEECKQKGLPWEKAKSFDGSALVGRFVKKEKFVSLGNLNFSLWQNNKIVQEGNTHSMLWSMDELVSYASRFFTLEKNDVIFTGTPQGVGNVKCGDTLRGYLQKKEMFRLNVRD